jgi:hypothetical protein
MQAKVQVKWRKQVYEIDVALDRPVLAPKTQVEPRVPLSPVYAPVVGRKVRERENRERKPCARWHGQLRQLVDLSG